MQSMRRGRGVALRVAWAVGGCGVEWWSWSTAVIGNLPEGQTDGQTDGDVLCVRACVRAGEECGE